MIDKVYDGLIRSLNHVKKSIEQLEKESSEGNAESTYDLAICYDDGYYVKKDDKKGAELLEKAIEQGCQKAKYVYAHHLIYGYGCEQNVEKALDYIKEGLNYDDPLAFTILGESYMTHGQLDKAVLTLSTAMDLGSDIAIEMLAVCYTTDEYRDENEAYRLYKIAGEKGCPLSACNLAIMYFRGWDVPINSQLGVKYIKISAEGKYPPAMSILGKLYFDGLVIEKDYNKSLFWYIRGAETKDPKSMFQCGAAILLFHDKYNLPVTDAIEWLDKAAKRGNVNAIELLIRVYSTGELGIPADKEKVYIYEGYMKGVGLAEQLFGRVAN